MAAVLVGNPFAGFARVVQVKHGRHAIDAQAVHVILLQPEEGAADQETADFGAAIIKNGAGPLGMKTFARVGVLIEVSAVKTRQPVAIGREMRRHPIHEDSDAPLMQVIHQKHEVLRRAVTAGRRKISRGLVTPRPVKRMLGQRHELDVREAHLPAIGGQFQGQLPIGQPAAPFLGHAHPGARMHFVDGNWRIQRIVARSLFHPHTIAPGIVEVPDDGGASGRQFGAERKRVGLLRAITLISRLDEILVARPGPGSGNEAFPNPAIAK